MGATYSTMQAFYILWSLLLMGPAAFSLRLAWTWHPTPLTIVLCMVATVGVVMNLMVAIGCFADSRPAWRASLFLMPLGIVVAVSPVLVRLSMPAEHPVTAAGSPIFAAMFVRFWGAFLGITLVLPGLIGMWWLVPTRADWLARRFDLSEFGGLRRAAAWWMSWVVPRWS